MAYRPTWKDTEDPLILGIESSCDDTAAAVFKGDRKLSNLVANQDVHRDYGGVVPELASRAHQENIIPVVDQALDQAGVEKEAIDGVAFTRGPGLLGALMVGASFAKAFAMVRKIPLMGIHHMKAHVLAHFIEDERNTPKPTPPFLCLTVSGGHTQIVRVGPESTMTVLGQTHDDAAGEAFDKAAKIMGLPYPGGPLIDKFGQEGNARAFSFPEPKIQGHNFSFSGLKTAFLYFLQEKQEKEPDFLEKNRNDICASFQAAVVQTLVGKLKRAAKDTGIREIAIAGGVSANSALRERLEQEAAKRDWNLYLPSFEYCTDNAAMIARAGVMRYRAGEADGLELVPSARVEWVEEEVGR